MTCTDPMEMADTPVKTEQSLSMRMVVSSIRKRFPLVSQINTGTLDQWISTASSQPTTALVMLDCRPEEEYNVSHIEGSLRVDPDLSDISRTLQHIQDKAQDKTEVKVVCYCSVGYRSSKYADAIQAELGNSTTDERLASKVKSYNLEGSLFQWANEGRPMVDYVKHKTSFAHPYNFVWGKLLDKELRRTDTKY